MKPCCFLCFFEVAAFKIDLKNLEAQHDLFSGADLLPDFFLDSEDLSVEDIDRLKQKKIVRQGRSDEIPSLFVKIKGLCNEDAVSSTQAIYQFNIDDHGIWFLDLKTGSGNKQSLF